MESNFESKIDTKCSAFVGNLLVFELSIFGAEVRVDRKSKRLMTENQVYVMSLSVGIYK